MDGLYLDELLPLIAKINKRRATEYRIAATIATFPHFDKKAKKEFMANLDTIDRDSKKHTEKMDVVGMEALKLAMSQNPRMLVKS